MVKKRDPAGEEKVSQTGFDNNDKSLQTDIRQSVAAQKDKEPSDLG